jgi:hypothetical protein
MDLCMCYEMEKKVLLGISFSFFLETNASSPKIVRRWCTSQILLSHLVWGGKMLPTGVGGGKIPATPGSDIKSMDWTTKNAYVTKFMSKLTTTQQKLASEQLESKQIDQQIEFLQSWFSHIHPFDDGYISPWKPEPDVVVDKKEAAERQTLVIMKGLMEHCQVVKEREITPTIWVCIITAIPDGYMGTLSEGSEVLVSAWNLFGVKDEVMDKIKKYKVEKESKKAHSNLQTIRIGSWNIRCTGEFQKKDNFFPALIQRFQRLAEFIKYSKCDIVALQEFPMKFKNSSSNVKVELDAQHLLPEFIRKLESETEESWGFGYSEDFPQACWTGDRTVLNEHGTQVDMYPRENGQYIQAFVFRRSKIECHSVEQVLDVTYQENRFKHAPSLGRFTFMRNFHFTLVNVHLRPEDTRNNTNSKFEIEDLGSCINQLKKYNPSSTIILGDFNMSACEWAPEPGGRYVQSNCTRFPPYTEGVWTSFRERNYTHAVQNMFTNTSDNKQFDNIWLPEELKEKHIVREIDEVPDVKYGYRKTDNVCRLQEYFSGESGKRLIDELTDHHLVFVDLEIDVAEETENIKKIFEVGNGLIAREYNGFHTPVAVLVDDTIFLEVPEYGEEERVKEEKVKEERVKEEKVKEKKVKEKKVKEEKVKEEKVKEEKVKEEKVKEEKVKEEKVKEEKTKTSEKKEKKAPSPVPVPVPDDRVLGCLTDARSHFLLWNIMDTVPSVADMGGPAGRLHWSKNLFPPDFTSRTVLGEEDKQAFDEMKRLETLYLEKLGEVKMLDEQLKAITKRINAIKEQLRKSSSASEIDNLKSTKNKIAKRKRELENEMENEILPEFASLIRSLSPSIQIKFVKIRALLPQP